MYETVIGLEVHIQLNTLTKMFCADDASFGGAPNSHTGVVSLALPGALPRTNRAAVERAAKLGMALGCEVFKESRFDRKNYFYADLPKGHQITQNALPVCLGGVVALPDCGATVRIHHIHMEEDAGKSIHDQDPVFSLIDLNRAGVPLLELVTEPDFRNAEQVSEFMEILRRLVRWLGISDGNMEEGSLRCDVNISLRPLEQAAYGQRCEIKNMNSMRFARQAIEHEVKRQTAVLQNGGTITQETRGFDAGSGTTYSLREKEQAHDYRYFPEPDLPPVRILTDTLETWRKELPQMPWETEKHFNALGLQPQDARLVCQEKTTADYLLAWLRDFPETPARAAANLLIQKLLPWCAAHATTLQDSPAPYAVWTSLINRVETGVLSSTAAYQHVFPAALGGQQAAGGGQQAAEAWVDALIEALGLRQNNDDAFLSELADGVLSAHPEKVDEYKKGKKGLMGFFMGELMKVSKGKADPKVATQILTGKLEGR